ncbi:hypothetical protein DL98DRAFT_472494 [Cadophora sp. DSE1049]|nr:hypothetical protein DL98DRAFT_472494 [Cadophora sp. DSE1049]
MSTIADLTYIIHHVFLPPKVPQGDDSEYCKDFALGKQCESALAKFRDFLPTDEHWKWAVCSKMMWNLLALREPCAGMMLGEVDNSFEQMDTNDALAFHIRGQNAGLIIRKLPGQFSFESFELSPTTESVMGTQGRLRRCFPGPAIALAYERMSDSYFREALAQVLTSLDSNTAPEVYKVVSKAQSHNIEIRETVHPKFVTELLTGVLRGIGQPYEANRFWKRTRDDVVFGNALKPWRRSPFWLLLRVALQTNLVADGSDHSDYKSFMIFFMAYILQLALHRSVPSEKLFFMAAKIGRRTQKLGLGDQQTGLHYVQGVVDAVHQELAKRWHSIERSLDPLGLCKAWQGAQLSFHSDTELSLLTLKAYLDRIWTRTKITASTEELVPICQTRTGLHEGFPHLDHLLTGGDHAARLSLLDLDLWAQNGLNEWMKVYSRTDTACTLVAQLIRRYTEIATGTYSNNPEDTSLMLLTTMELWVAIDKCATRQHPLLRMYDPGFPPSLFDPLLLPKRAHMARLTSIEQYLQERRDTSRHSSSLIFQVTNETNSFAVKYFEQSHYHQELREEIEAAASLERAAKKAELVQLTQKYHELLQRSNSRSHDQSTEWNGYEDVSQHYPSDCQKCILKRGADALEITVHEWPLPYLELEAKSAVFELDVPKAIAEWRDTTFALLEDVFSPPKDRQPRNPKIYWLREYRGLIKHACGETKRLQLASEAKSHLVAHYRTKKVPQAEESNICVKNGLHYSIYDTKSCQRTSNLLDQSDVRRLCTFQLPPGPRATLQYVLDGTTHSSNEALARQSDCPSSFNLHEFYAFMTLRSGHRLQWRNIARELTARILNFSHRETYMLIAQAAWQAGCSNTAESSRDSHVDLEEEEFGVSLVTALGDALQTVEGNWQGATALHTFVILTTRLLSLSPHGRVHEYCYLFLKRARWVSLQWARELGQLLHDEQDTEELKTLNLRALEIALICHGTFDVDEAHLSTLLLSDEDVAAITECCIIIHDRCPAQTERLDTFLKTLLRRFERSSHLMELKLRFKILENQRGIDRTVQRVWAGYRQGSSWRALCEPNERWLTTETSAECGKSAVSVDYNVLDGSLLVMGSPLTRLLRSYELHDTYIRIFGEKVLDVVPSSMPGMIFEMRDDFHGQQLHFCMCESELIIRSQKQQQVCELIPVSAIFGDFPQSFAEDFVHWLDLATHSIEWRPLNSIWTQSVDNWQMHKRNDKYYLTRASEKLLDIRSPTVKAISRILSPLEVPSHVHVVLDCQTDALQIRLPRMKLDFLLKDATGSLESKQFRGMMLDECQSLGTFTGLVNKLVLRDIKGRSRCVIVPHGSISFVPQGHHVEVTVSTTSAKHVGYHAYQVDSKLGRLVDNGSLQSRLFRLYLHATTSYCLIDELTGRTGTEEALYGLEGAATQSFVTLSTEVIELLKNFARLTPRRKFYPKHLKVMQQIEWNSLPTLSQHSSFYPIVKSILERAKSFQIFQEEPVNIPPVDRGERFLLEKAAIRDSWLRVYSFGASTFTAEHDRVYEARDQTIDGERELRTCHTTQLVDSWSTNLKVCRRLLAEMEAWKESLSGPGLGDVPTIGFDVKWLHPPSKIFPKYWCSLYRLADGYTPAEHTLIGITKSHLQDLNACPEASLQSLPGESNKAANARRRILYVTARDENIRMFVRDLTNQGSTIDVQTPSSAVYRTYIRVKQVMRKVRTHFQSWHRNSQFRTHVEQLQAALGSLRPEQHGLQPYSFWPAADCYTTPKTFVEFADLTRQPAPHILHTEPNNFGAWTLRDERRTCDNDKLRDLLHYVKSRCLTSHERQYAGDLLRSAEALRTEDTTRLTIPIEGMSILEAHLSQVRQILEVIHGTICDRLQVGLSNMTQTTKLLPRLSPTSLLSHLAHAKFTALPDDWKISLVQYALAITAVQRAERLLAVASNPTALLNELENPGHQDWDPLSHPEWILLEIENDILIRQEQAQISHEMSNPSSGSNSVMQLNMGLGKTSVIVPITAADLADGQKLVRVVVLKPLAMQMFQSLVKKLGAMIDRRIVYMPISRSLDINADQARQIRRLYEECVRTGAIVLIQPEHILSFELLGLERLSAGLEVGKVMVETQHWLHMNSRDIFDESDEILSVKFELIYTMGTQRAIEFSPDRWTIIQHVLGVLGRTASTIHEKNPQGLEVLPTASGGFPRIRIVKASTGAQLLENVALQLCTVGLPGVNMWSLSPTVKSDIHKFITNESSNGVEPSIQDLMSTSDSMMCSLFLLKGLFACRVLTFALAQKRWRVDYGLDPSRTRLAVPYHAKDSPAARAEFSHPDVTIVLTCLCYYYSGLTDEEVRISFEVLLQSDQAKEEYERWVRDAPSLPPRFKHLTGINLRNFGQCSCEVFPPLRFAKAMIDFYLAVVVFPAEMKEFPLKLSTSGWDLAREKAHFTTGFSGTNDSRYVMPLSISQCDLPAQLSTNAAVLDCLLRSENTFADITPHLSTGILDAEALLRVAATLDPPVRVILDVGAQVLELQNEAFATTWLSRIPDAQAVIFVDVRNEICVLSRDGRTESLQVSPFAKQMDQCLVYLDESHTRGTDLKLPDDYRAIVTLGPGLTKDRLVQACMRMRKLGKGQSVVFCSSLEVQRKILEYMSGCSIDVADVLAWCIAGTCEQTKKSITLWAAQGLRHQDRQAKYSHSPVTPILVDSLLEPEAQSLRQRYGHELTQHENEILHEVANPGIRARQEQLNAIRAKCREFEIHSFATSTLQEEQERELSPENEREQQVELPPKVTPCRHSVHPDVRRFVVHGELDRLSSAFIPAFETFRNTTASTNYERAAWPRDLLVTTDFASTVCATAGQSLDFFLRPVHWIVSCKRGSDIDYVILSPYEAQELLPSIRTLKRAILHSYSPRLNFSVRTLEDLSSCAIPPVPKSWSTPAIANQLNLFAGQLYVRDYEDYSSLCNFLGLCTSAPDDQTRIAYDGFVNLANRALSDPNWNSTCPFETSPVDFVRAVISFRRKGQSTTVSHLGRILNGELIPEDYFTTHD